MVKGRAFPTVQSHRHRLQPFANHDDAAAQSFAQRKARQTVAAIEAALESNETTAIAEIIQIIHTLAARAFKISIPELSQLIGRDPTITEKVISAANTLGFNPHATPISTVSQAIHTIGFEKVRNLTISLMLTQNAGHWRNTPEQREMAAIAVCSGMLAQTLVQQRESSIDDELAFVCASLRNYGKLLLASFLIDDFRAARMRAESEDEETAFREVFGIGPLALGQEILQKSTLPKSITTALRPVGLETLLRPPAGPADEALFAAELSSRLCAVAFDERIGPDQFNHALMDVLSRFQRSFPVGLETVNQAFLSVEMQLSQLNRVIGIRDELSPATVRLLARAAGEPLPLRPKLPPRRMLAPLSPDDVRLLAAAEAEATFQTTLARIKDEQETKERVDLKAIYTAAARAVLDTLQLSSCLVFLPEQMEPDKFSARYGLGPLFEKSKNRPLISPRNRDVFAICLARKEDILIQDSKTGKVSSVIPEWINAAARINSFIALPVVAGPRLFALIVGCAAENAIVSPSEDDLRRIRLLRSELAHVQRKLESKELIPA